MKRIRISKLRNKLLLINCCLLILVFFSQSIFQNIFFDSYYENHQLSILKEKLTTLKTKVEAGTLSSSQLLELTDSNSIILSYLNEDYTQIDGNLYLENTYSVKGDDGKEYQLYVNAELFNEYNLTKGSLVEAQVYKVELSDKLYLRSMTIMNETGELLHGFDGYLDSGIEEDETIFSLQPQIKESFTLTGKLTDYTVISIEFLNNQKNVVDLLYKENLSFGKQIIRLNGSKNLFYLQPVDSGYVVGAISLKQSKEIFAILNGFNVYIGLLSLGVIFILAIYYANKMTRPILVMKKGALAIAKQDFSENKYIQTGDELEELGDALNKISSNLEQKIIELEDYHDQLEKQYEERLEMEQSQKNLLMNISHDLKTPLTVIKGYLKAIKDGVYEKEDYIHLTMESVDEISETLSEMIELTKYRSKSYDLQEEDIDLSRIIYKNYNQFYQLCKEKKQALDVEIVDEAFIKGDEKAIYKVIENIIMNGIKYSDTGAAIHVQLIEKGKGYLFTVENEGAHIKEEDLQHVFDAFYRIDKSRNEKIQGNGLGLSIVKIILERHGYEYGIENTAGGVKFWIHFED